MKADKPVSALAAVQRRMAAETTDSDERAHRLNLADEMLAFAEREEAARPSARELLGKLASRIEIILSLEEDPEALMSAILAQAEGAGIIDASGAIRTHSPWLFAMDLLTENPSAYEWAQLAGNWIDPAEIRTRSDLLDALAPYTAR